MNDARAEARAEFVWNMHTGYSGVADEAFDGGWEAHAVWQASRPVTDAEVEAARSVTHD